MKTDLSYERLRELLEYNPEEGTFTWLSHRRCRHLIGKKIRGCKSSSTLGLTLILEQVRYSAARIAWLYMTGAWPERRLFFADGNPQNVKFENLSLAKEGRHDRSREGKRASNREYRNSRPIAVSNAYLKYRFGITLGEYRNMIVNQKGVCAICEEPETTIFRGQIRQLAVDHDHGNGKIRGLLCFRCNTGLGSFQDQSNRLERAAEYLRQHAQPHNVVPLKRGA